MMTLEEARELVKTLPDKGKWPCLFTESDTTGEKDFEEFFTSKEELDMDKFKNLGVIKNKPEYDEDKLNNFVDAINKIKLSKNWDKELIVNEFFKIMPEFEYEDKGKYLNEKM